MKYRILNFSTIALLTLCFTACAFNSGNHNNNSENVSETR